MYMNIAGSFIKLSILISYREFPNNNATKGYNNKCNCSLLWNTNFTSIFLVKHTKHWWGIFKNNSYMYSNILIKYTKCHKRWCLQKCAFGLVQEMVQDLRWTRKWLVPTAYLLSPSLSFFFKLVVFFI